MPHARPARARTRDRARHHVPGVPKLHDPVRGELSQAHLLDQLHAAGMASQAGWLTFRLQCQGPVRPECAADPCVNQGRRVASLLIDRAPRVLGIFSADPRRPVRQRGGVQASDAHGLLWFWVVPAPRMKATAQPSRPQLRLDPGRAVRAVPLHVPRRVGLTAISRLLPLGFGWSALFVPISF
jgi:hypothetical protein